MKTMRELMEAVVSDEQRLVNAISAAWQQIAFDIPEESVTTEDMIELATDASRLEMFGYEDEQRMWSQLVSEKGYAGAIAYLAPFFPYKEWEAGGSSAL